MVSRPLLLLVAIAALAIGLPATTISAQLAAETAPGSQTPVIADPENKFTYVPPDAVERDAVARRRPNGPNGPLPANAVSVIVNYSGFTALAQAAFQAAVDIWAAQLTTTVPVSINATWAVLGAGVLGQAGPNNFHRNFVGAPAVNRWYPAAAANKLAGSDLAPGTTGSNADMALTFNSSFANWYFGLDGATPGGQYDFMTVVLHELGHGFTNAFGDWLPLDI